ncbi:hypothetical protein SUGI_0141670 [Cryptomeria japonica]|nr:hypothetical protein SUGI_0141670 [Cryptomeria japonica]
MQPANRKTPPTHEGPDVHPSSGEDLEGVQNVEVEARQNDVAPSVQVPSLNRLCWVHESNLALAINFGSSHNFERSE